MNERAQRPTPARPLGTTETSGGECHRATGTPSDRQLPSEAQLSGSSGSSTAGELARVAMLAFSCAIILAAALVRIVP